VEGSREGGRAGIRVFLSLVSRPTLLVLLLPVLTFGFWKFAELWDHCQNEERRLERNEFVCVRTAKAIILK